MTDKTRISPQQYLAIVIPCVLGWAFTYLAINILKGYGFGLFIWMPIVLGIISTVVLTYKNPQPRAKARNHSYLSLFIYCLGLFFFSWEGVICLIMAAPLGFVFNYLGFVIGYAIYQSRFGNNTPATVLLLGLSVPSFMAFEYKVSVEGELRKVTTSIEIVASQEKVWKNVISFPELRAPDELLFKAGISYPISAAIEGKGEGAIRRCNFSTGSFVEPITTWSEPNRLSFSVDQQPEPMHEISIYNIHPNHLRGYWVSKKGEFKLRKLSNGNTLLEGTTWYVNKIKPGIYWTLWSDYIVHAIHKRVLDHIKNESEKG